MPMAEMTEVVKLDLALALLLWRDYRSNREIDPVVTLQALGYARALGVEREFKELLEVGPPAASLVPVPPSVPIAVRAAPILAEAMLHGGLDSVLGNALDHEETCRYPDYEPCTCCHCAACEAMRAAKAAT